jgi:TRAP-type uncharacterized transport system substrate-binding protein
MDNKTNPSVSRYIWRGICDECVAILALIRHEWLIVSVLAALIVFGVSALKPLPSSVVRIGSGQPGSGIVALATAYRDELKKHGVRAELVVTAGAVDNLAKVSKGVIDVGFTQSGIAAPANVSYMGSIDYQPLWLFYRAPAPISDDLAAFLIGKRVSIGILGSGSRMASDWVLERFGEDVRSRIRLLPLDAPATIEDMIEGRIDAAFFLSPLVSPNVQRILADPTISLYDFKNAAGAAFLMGFADHVTLPAGALSLFPVRPPQNTHMLAATIPLVVRSDMHPALQNLLLIISKEMGQRISTPFERGRSLPAFLDKQLPRSPIAERYYNYGGPILIGRLPFWLATLLDSIWVAVIALFAIVYPLVRLMPSYRGLFVSAIHSRYYRRARQIERAQRNAKSLDELQKCEAQINDLLTMIREMWVPNGFSSAHGALLTAVMSLDADLKWRKAQLDP